ncbi:YgaP family membrane protein [Reyranella sp.]|uniref:YgaP family membrane protein n=1 Tax=Reyranella sp. TaxID=1929291 RepID=UPI003D141D1F
MGFTRNVPGRERAARALPGISLLASVVVVPPAGWALWAALATGVALILTALAGLCPACAMIGRRP